MSVCFILCVTYCLPDLKNILKFFAISIVCVYTKCYLWGIIKSKAKMTYLHTITDTEGNQVESVYSNSNTPKLSLTSLKKVINGEYKIWNRNDWTFIIV